MKKNVFGVQTGMAFGYGVCGNVRGKYGGVGRCPVETSHIAGASHVACAY